MYRLYFCFSLFLLYPFKLASSFGRMLGPSVFIFRTLDYCPGSEGKGGIDLSFIQRKFNRTNYVYDIDLSSEYNISDILTVEFKTSMKKEGGYKPGAYYLKKELCEAFHVFLDDVFDDFLNRIGFSDCPITAGSYRSEGFYFNNQKFNVPQIYGEYKMEFNIWQDDVLIRCIRGFYEFAPK